MFSIFDFKIKVPTTVITSIVLCNAPKPVCGSWVFRFWWWHLEIFRGYQNIIKDFISSESYLKFVARMHHSKSQPAKRIEKVSSSFALSLRYTNSVYPKHNPTNALSVMVQNCVTIWFLNSLVSKCDPASGFKMESYQKSRFDESPFYSSESQSKSKNEDTTPFYHHMYFASIRIWVESIEK